MMGIKSKEIRFGYLISHTLPGFILAIELVFCIDMLTEHRIWFSILKEIRNFPNLLGILGIFAVLATMLGIVIDAFQHLMFEIYEYIFAPGARDPQQRFAEHRLIKSEEQLNIYRYLVDDALWYYYESYCNTAISLIPGFFVVPLVLKKLGISGMSISLSRIFILISIIILFAEGIITRNQFKEADKEFAKGLEKKETNNT